MAVDVADTNRCKQRVIAILNASDEDSAYSATTADFSEFSADEVEDVVLEADEVFCLAIISNPTHPYRNKFITASPTELTNGDKVPEYMGAGDKVEVQIGDGAAWVPAKQARNYTRILEIIADTSMPDDVRQRYYFRENGRLYTAATKARVYVAEFSRAGGARPIPLKAPRPYERGIIAMAVAGLYKGTTSQSLHEFYLRQAQMMLSIVGAGGTNLPEIEIHRRRNG